MADEVLSHELNRCDITTVTGQLHAGAVPPVLAPCPQCGLWQWLVGVIDRVCTACGYRGGPQSQVPITPQNTRR
jgi:hypothetical protein